MKLLILACVLSVVAADLFKAATPKVDKAVKAFLKGSSKTGQLSTALGLDEPWLDEVGDDIKTELGKHLREALNDLLEKIKDHVEHGKNVGKVLQEKVKEIQDQLKVLKEDIGNKAKDLLEKIKIKAKEALQKLLDKMGLGKRNLDFQMDAVARSSLRDVLEKMKEKIEGDISKIREYIKNIAADSPFARKLKEFVEHLKDDDLREILRHILDYKPGQKVMRGETMNKIKEFFKDLELNVHDNTEKFAEWLKSSWDKGTDELRKKFGTIRAIALEYVSKAKDTTVDVAQEALDFFRPYEHELGSLWPKIVKATKEAIGKF